jgi:hypothetical protein
LVALYDFLVSFLDGDDFRLQVSEVHLCADVAGWELSLQDAPAFIARGHRRTSHVEGESPADESEAIQIGAGSPNDEDGAEYVAPALEVNLHGRRCTGFEFSQGAIHSCCIYDKTKELAISRKEWMRAVWEQHGWDGTSRVTRVEFRYKRECLKELGIEDPYEMLDQVAGMWSYSTMCWLRHTVPTEDTNRGRWLASSFWQAVQAAEYFGDPVPLGRARKTAGDLTVICQMIAGCSTTAAAFLAGQLPDADDGTHFLIWFSTWLEHYLAKKHLTFRAIRVDKQVRFGIAPPDLAA